MLTIEFWSDYACPFCYIGKRRLQGALEKFEHRDRVEVIFRSYQLAPDAERDSELNIYEGLAARRGISIEEAKENMQKPVEQAKEFGIEMNFDRVIPTNTMDAHRLVNLAVKHNKSWELAERLMKAYFTDGLHIGDHAVLTGLAIEVGLDRAEVERLLASDEYADVVRQERELGLQSGLKMIPHIMINGEYVYFGGQTSDMVLEALHKAWDARENATSSDDQITVVAGDGCTADGCAI